MKKWFGVLLLVFSFSYGQNDTINPLGVVSAEKMNIVYRGIANRIAIAVSNCKSFTATAPGLTKVSEGHYYLSPGSGLEVAVILTITLYDDSVIIEKHTFRIKNIPNPIAKINGRNCSNCIVNVHRSEFEDATVTVDVGVEFDLNFDVRQFSVKIPKEESIVVLGNSFEKIYKKLSTLKTGTQITISEVKFGANLEGCIKNAIPIVIEVVDDEIPFYETKEFIKDSLQNIRNQRNLELKEKRKK
ncbi:MAG: GldM family protein [Flavobacterium sp.]|nr:GldM family protein [Flavobacterium sp.]